MEVDTEPRPQRPKLEVGWVLAGRFDEADRRAAALARREMRAYLRDTFPDFDWQFPTVARREMAAEAPVEPVTLLDGGVAERDVRRWDFALVLTQADLVSYFKPYALGVPSRAVQTAVASTARIDPEALPSFADEGAEEERPEVLGRRLYALLMHLLGHLVGLGHADEAGSFMYAPRAVGDLDQMRAYGDEEQAVLLDELHDEADERLEEGEMGTARRAQFYLRAVGAKRGDIARAVLQVRPWTFPGRFSRLTAAAVSALVVLLTTAEAWELGMSQPLGRVALLSGAALLGASAFLVRRQGLLRRRRAPRRSEQRVVAATSVTVAVGLGMATTYVFLFGLTLALGSAFYTDALVEGWAASVEGPLRWGHRFALAGFVAALGLVIGALGASFEEQGYFRHVAFVDEET